MTDEKKLDYSEIESTPANKLMELPYEELDAYIAEAKRIQHDAEAVMEWLTAIRSMKAQRAYAARNSNGDAHG